MGAGSLWHWILLLLVVVLLFGRGKISELMGDFAKGIKSFKKGMADDDDAVENKPAPRVINDASASAKDPAAPTKAG